MKKKNGFIVLVCILVFLAVTLGFAALAIFLSLDEALSTVTHEHIGGAYGAASACIEEAMLGILNDPNYAGLGGMDVDGIPCSASVQRSGNDYTIQAEASTERALRRITVNITRTGNRIILNNWSETY